jgi:hypothetical protein
MNYKCTVCGKEFNKRRYTDDICSPECFIKAFWDEALSNNPIIIDGYCYTDGGNNPNGDPEDLGFGGYVFTIEFLNGNRITTNNLRLRGLIPAHLHVKDNAKFIRK